MALRTLGLLGVVTAALFCAVAVQAETFLFTQDYVLGTSLQLRVNADKAETAEACQRVVLDEITRLDKILSTYHATTPAARLSGGATLNPAPAELREVLLAYEHWNQRTQGAYNGQLGGLISLWRQAAQDNQLPTPGQLRKQVELIGKPAWKISGEEVQRLTDAPLNLDSLGKGYVITRAVERAVKECPDMDGVSLNIGGDIRTWTKADAAQVNDPWLVEIADPFQPQENAPALATLRLTRQAISTSGAYARFYTIAGKNYSHIMDPRTGQPAQGVVSATVVADDNIKANAMATSLCVLGVEAGLALARQEGVEAFMVASDGQTFSTPGWAALTVPEPLVSKPPTTSQPAVAGWPEGFRVTFTTDIKPFRKRPYLAVWVMDSKNNAIRTLTVQGGKDKYQRSLKQWYGMVGGKADVVKQVTRATKPAGQLELVWDGKDDKGVAVPPGTYRLCLELVVEEGPYCISDNTIECGKKPATGTIKGTNGFGDVKLGYGPAVAATQPKKLP